MRLPFGRYSFTLRSLCYFLPLLPHSSFSASLPHTILFKARLEGGDGVYYPYVGVDVPRRRPVPAGGRSGDRRGGLGGGGR